LAGNKIIGGDCIWGQEYPLINSLIKAVKHEKFTKMIKRTADILVSVAAAAV
jgi:hypothetical protein